MRKKIGFYMLAFLLLSIAVSGQEISKQINSAEVKQTTKIDEFGDISEKEFSSKLKKFAEILRNNNSATAYVVFYNDFNSTPFRKTRYFAEAKFKSYKEYLTSRIFDSPRIVFVPGGLREKMTTELWLVPPKNEPPKPASPLEYAKNEKYKLDKFETKRLPIEEAGLKQKKSAEDIETDENELPFEEEILFYFNKDWERFYQQFAEELSEVLSRDETWKAKLFFYVDEDEYDVQKIRQTIENQLKINFEKSNGDLNRVEIIFGGYRSNPQLETWIIPKNGIEPEPMPDEKIEAN